MREQAKCVLGWSVLPVVFGDNHVVSERLWIDDVTFFTAECVVVINAIKDSSWVWETKKIEYIVNVSKS